MVGSQFTSSEGNTKKEIVKRDELCIPLEINKAQLRYYKHIARNKIGKNETLNKEEMEVVALVEKGVSLFLCLFLFVY